MFDFRAALIAFLLVAIGGTIAMVAASYEPVQVPTVPQPTTYQGSGR